MDVRLPNGVVIRNVPEGTSKDEIRAKAIRSGLATGADFGEPSDAVAQIPREGQGGVPQAGKPIENPTYLDSAIAGAAAVPVLGGVVKGAQLLTRGSRAAPYLARLAESVIPKTGKALVAEGAIGAATGVTAKMGADAMPDGWGPVGEILGGVSGGVAASYTGNALRNGKALVEGAPALFSSVKDLTNQMTQQLGSSKAAKSAAAAFGANPRLGPTIDRAAEIERTTGVSLPVLAAANGDTTISTYIQKQIAKGDNTEFTAGMKEQYEAAEEALRRARNGVAPTMEAVDAFVMRKKAVATEADKKAKEGFDKLTTNRARGEQRIGFRLEELGDQLANAPSRTDIGERLTKLVEVREQLASREVGPKYDRLIAEETEKGVVLPGTAAKGLRDFVTQAQSDDIFNKFPGLYSTIKRVFKPEQSAIASSKAAQKYTFAKQGETFSSYSLKDLDSLKRETNEALRNVEFKSDQHRMLTELKRQVDAAIDSTSPEFAQAYRAIDAEYAQKVGIPFHENGVLRVNQARFVEDTVPMITGRASSLKQILNAIGDTPEGMKIIDDAFMFDIGRTKGVINEATGELNPVKLQAYLRRNKDKISQVPGLEQRLTKLADRGEELVYNRNQIIEARARARLEPQNNLWTQAFETSGGVRGVVRSALNNQAELEKLVQIAAKDRAAGGAIKSAMLDDVMNAPGDRIALLKDNKVAFDKIFGPQYTQKIVDMVEASQRLRDNPIALKINVNTVNKTAWQEITGSRPETTLGELRNQVMTFAKSVINHGTRFMQSKSEAAESAAMQDFLSDSKALQQYAELLKEVELRGFKERAVGMLGKLLSNSSFRLAMGAGTGAVVGGMEAVAEDPARETEATNPLLKGYGQ